MVSVVCHGSIERDFWKMYLNREMSDGEISNITMRDKTKGWSNYGLKIVFSDGRNHTTFRNTDGYSLQAYTDGLFQRFRCLHCSYKGTNIKSDILLGDAWGWDSVYPKFCDLLGVSVVLCQTLKGKRIFDLISNNVESVSIDLEQAISKNKRIVSPAKQLLNIKHFQNECRNNPEKINTICKVYTQLSFKNKVIRKISSIFNISRLWDLLK